AVAAVKRLLLPLATVVTPNAPEAAVLSGLPVESPTQAREAARIIASLGAGVVVVKGGHLPGERAVDLVYDGEAFHELPSDWVATRNTHGTGCTFSAAIAAYIARGLAPLPAVAAAKAFLTEALRNSYAIGEGHSPVNHFWRGIDRG
ncbi:MAG: bifunctional hydroxymethylpyrimidine kinase/phosphomethylpyrimidine kinase, partial [Thermomicrobiales bacterium]|nr:bifunctional hydroxymethylpyrimidine kinase/phosphomethylpyrimidine kinase [Thermomicrobiales bacterium]